MTDTHTSTQKDTRTMRERDTYKHAVTDKRHERERERCTTKREETYKERGRQTMEIDPNMESVIIFFN